MIPEGHLFWAAADVSAWVKPPWWRHPIHWLRWRQHDHQRNVYLTFLAALRGEQEPVRRYGIHIDYSLPESPTDQILRQIARLVIE